MSSPKVEDVISAPASNYHQNHGLNLQFDLQGYFSHEMLRSFQHTLCFFFASCSPGAIKLSLPGSALLDCAKAEPPSNSLFPDVNPVRVEGEIHDGEVPSTDFEIV